MDENVHKHLYMHKENKIRKDTSFCIWNIEIRKLQFTLLQKLLVFIVSTMVLRSQL